MGQYHCLFLHSDILIRTPTTSTNNGEAPVAADRAASYLEEEIDWLSSIERHVLSTCLLTNCTKFSENALTVAHLSFPEEHRNTLSQNFLEDPIASPGLSDFTRTVGFLSVDIPTRNHPAPLPAAWEAQETRLCHHSARLFAPRCFRVKSPLSNPSPSSVGLYPSGGVHGV